MIVYYHVPDKWPLNGCVVMVMHGMDRDAEAYMRTCMDVTRNTRVAIICPEFSRAEFPTRVEYNWGNVISHDGHQLSLGNESLSVIEGVYDDFCARVGRCGSLGYYLYGHSAGAQFVHRCVALEWCDRIIRAFACNAGVWTFPTVMWRYPFGMAGVEEHIRAFLQAPLVVMLGEEDTDPCHRHLDTSPLSMAQGATRLERGLHFFSAGRQAAQVLCVPFGWTLYTVGGAGHSHRAMFNAFFSYYLRDTI